MRDFKHPGNHRFKIGEVEERIDFGPRGIPERKGMSPTKN